ncbi:MAG: hypothetical protein ACYCSG_07190 [Thermoplasmataceae archaeon]
MKTNRLIWMYIIYLIASKETLFVRTGGFGLGIKTIRMLNISRHRYKILMLKILSDTEQKDVLLETMVVFNGACNDVSRTSVNCTRM